MHRLNEPFTYKYNVYRTMQQTFEEICTGQDPWIPLGKFMNHWYGDHPDERGRLIIDPLPEIYPPIYHRWAVFCAASVEWFARTYDVPCPEWVHHPRYALAEPWIFHEGRRETLLQTTPQEFARRNIYCGADIYANKWEFVADLWVRYPEKLAAKVGRPSEDLLPYIEAARRKRARQSKETPG
jgi:hypothetical protein